MPKKNAFTLIEVMVVLSVLAMVAVLAYNFFGSVIKDAKDTQAAASLANDMKNFEFAYSELVRTNGADPANNTINSAAVAAGIIKAGIKPDRSIYRPTCASAWSAISSGYWSGAATNYAASPAIDYHVSMECIPESVCKKFNELYTTVGATIPINANDVELQGGRLCYGTSSQAWGYTILQLMDSR